MRLFKRKEVPTELPHLAIEEMCNGDISSESKAPKNKFKDLPKLPSEQSTEADEKNSFSGEEGYFKKLVKSVTEETENLEKLDSWYKNKFLPGDIVFQMREYWQKQQPEILLKNVSGDLKNRLMEKTEKLHQLEKEWQEVYFILLSKEEEIRKEEKELKNSLSEFMELFKKFNKEKK